jgi:hypothetical protein
MFQVNLTQVVFKFLGSKFLDTIAPLVEAHLSFSITWLKDVGGNTLTSGAMTPARIASASSGLP